MRNAVLRSTAYKFIIILAALVLVLSVWPGKIWKDELRKELTHNTSGKTEVINHQNYATQVFVANADHLDRVRIYVSEGTVTKYFHMILADAKGKQLADETVYIEEVPGYIDVLMDVDTVTGELYTLKATSLQSLYLGQEQWIPNPDIIAISFYNTTQLDGMNLVMDYYYNVPMSWQKNVYVIGIIVLVALVLLALGMLFFKKYDKLTTVEQCTKCVCNPLIAVFGVFCLICIALGKVSKHGIDNVVAVVGVVFLVLIMLYAVNHNRDGERTYLTKDYILTHIPDLIQSVAIAGAIQACCEYVSGLYDIHHRVAERKEMLWFALIIIAMFEFKEIVNLTNLCYVVAAGVAGAIYYKKNVVELTTTEDIFVLRATVAIAVLLGLIVMRTFIRLFRKKMPSPNKLFAIILGIYFVGIIVFRNTRWWTVTLAVGFTLLYLNYAMWSRKKNFMVNVVRGAALQFILVTIWCWMYRPYCTFRTARFKHFFHTETITATYLTMMLCVALTMVLVKVYKYRNDLKLKYLWKEFGFFGVVATYLVMTMARTAYAAAVVTVAFGFILVFANGIKRKGAAGVVEASVINVGSKAGGNTNPVIALKTLGYLAVSVFICLPVIFEIQRTVPCLVSNPYEYEIDNFQDENKRGRKLNAEEYMRVGEFCNVFANKIFGMPENSIDVYGEYSREFNEYHMTVRELYEIGPYDFHDVEVKDEEWDELPTEELFGAYINRGAIEEEVEATEQEVIEEEAEAGEQEVIEEEVEATEQEVIEEEAEAGEQEVIEEEVEATEQETMESEAVEEEVVEPEEVSDDDEESIDYTNGRLDIYKSYIEQLNMTGHDSMGATLADGEIAAHAHDVYLQVAYDHGIPMAIVFVIFGISTFVLAIKMYLSRRITEPYSLLTAIILVAFAVAGVVEWTFHLGHPMSMVLLLSIAPLLLKIKNI